MYIIRIEYENASKAAPATDLCSVFFPKPTHDVGPCNPSQMTVQKLREGVIKQKELKSKDICQTPLTPPPPHV